MKLPPFIEDGRRRVVAAWNDRAIMLKVMSFALIGCINTAIDFGVFSLGYFFFGLPIVVANVISWTAGVTNSYLMNSQITFAAESGRRLRLKDYLMFALAMSGGLVANTATVVIASYFMPVLYAKVLAIGASFVVDFSLSHFVVFRRRESNADR